MPFTAEGNPREIAGQYYDSGLNCAQSVLRATTGRADEELMAITKAFGSGIGGAKCLCGAVNGGVVALAINGRGELAAELVKRFKEKNRVTCCSALTRPFRWGSSEHLANCRALTAETAEIVAALLEK
ncbi:C-GCAxxG-C-C family protein [Desulfuromonas versatilis]|uniref:C-GCAxxG-C-C family protein n=1 Tax=Desulfuromonas versatilis TaxID=2802975 RepID=UPI001C855023|nr:C-GCAxxG-C-C family protein [Desulfuromonas versatilis]